jgi:nucleoside-diphosphate-sugar epimerase
MILITGAGGFLGRHVVRQALEEPANHTVRAWLLPSEDLEFRNLETLRGDLLDEDLLARAVAGVEAVVHLASKNVDLDGTGFERVNVEGTRRLCRAAVAAGVRRIVYVSTVGVYGHGTHRGADEITPLAPDTPFSRSKAAAEQILLDHHRAGELKALILRHRFVYGEGDLNVIPRLIRAARRYPFWISGGRAKISVVFAEDFARVAWRLASTPPASSRLAGPNPVLHVTDGRPISYRELITTICNALGYRVPRLSLPFWLLYLPVRLRERLLGIDPERAAGSISSIRLKLVARDNYFSSEELQHLLPDLQFLSFREGFEKSLASYAHLR